MGYTTLLRAACLAAILVTGTAAAQTGAAPNGGPDTPEALSEDAATGAAALGISAPPALHVEGDLQPDAANEADPAAPATAEPDAVQPAPPGPRSEAPPATPITQDGATTPATGAAAPGDPDRGTDDANEDDGATATAAGALGLTSPPDTRPRFDGAAPGASDAAAAAAGALGIAPSAPPPGSEGGRRTVNVAVLDESPPFSYTGRFGVRTGFDVDLASALCRRMEIRCNLMPMVAEDIVHALVDRRVAWAVASPSITPQPGAAISFTEPYAHLTVRFVTPQRRAKDIEADDMVYGALAGTAQAAYLREHFRQPDRVRLYPNAEGLWIDLSLGRLDGVLAPAITARREFLATSIGVGFTFAAAAGGGSDALARPAVIGVRQRDTDLAAALNQALDAFVGTAEFEDMLSRNLDRDLVAPVDPKS